MCFSKKLQLTSSNCKVTYWLNSIYSIENSCGRYNIANTSLYNVTNRPPLSQFLLVSSLCFQKNNLSRCTKIIYCSFSIIINKLIFQLTNHNVSSKKSNSTQERPFKCHVDFSQWISCRTERNILKYLLYTI